MSASRRFTVPAAILLGVAIGLIGPRNTPAPPGEGGKSKTLTPVPTNATPTPGIRRPEGIHQAASAGAYAYAWNSLKDGQLPRKDRLELQQTIIREWAMIDLAAAIRAVSADQSASFWHIGVDDPLRKALRPGIAAQPELVWHLVETHALGLHTKWLREAWIQEMGRQNSKRLVDRSSNFSPNDRDVAMRLAVAFAGAAGKPHTELDQVVDAVISLPTAPSSLPPRKGLINELRSTIGYPELLERVRNTQDPKRRGVFLEAYLGLTLCEPIDPETVPEWRSELNSLPSEIREEAEKLLENKWDL